jgi:hypothetical protein
MQWFVSNTNIVFKTKRLAMWQWFSKKPEQADTAKWYIPYYDRI